MCRKEYAVAALDMDGTLLNSRHEITPYTLDVIRRAAGAGKAIALATGRCMSELWEYIPILDSVRYIICENGACIYDVRRKERLCAVSVPEAETEFLIGVMERYDGVAQMTFNDWCYLRARRELDLAPYYIEQFRSLFDSTDAYRPELFEFWRRERPNTEKLCLHLKNAMDCAAFCREIEDRPVAVAPIIRNAEAVGVEISAKGVDKGYGLKMLCGCLDIPLEQSMAVGDGGNDLQIIRAAGLGVAMGNAVPEIAELADVMTDDCDHDGAAKAIEKYMLG